MGADVVKPRYAPQEKPAHGAIVVYPAYAEIKLTQLFDALLRLAPDAKLGDWAGPYKVRPSDDIGTNMLSIDGVRLSMLNADAALPPAFYDPGPCGNSFIPDAMRRLSANRAHVLVIPTAKPAGLLETVETARAVTLLTWAIVAVTKAPAFRWTDSLNVVPARVFDACASDLTPRGGLGIPIWIRILADLGPRGKDGTTIIVGTFGLWAFGLPEIEFEPINLPTDYVVPRAYAIIHYMLTSGKSLGDGETFQLEGADKFRITLQSKGTLVAAPALRLSWAR